MLIENSDGKFDGSNEVEGIALGSRVGIALGSRAGWTFGETLIDLVGPSDGILDGWVVGNRLGGLLSLKDGFSDGRAVKSREGPSEGTLVGDPLGMIDDGKQVYGRDKGPLSYRQQKKLINKTTKRLYLVIKLT